MIMINSGLRDLFMGTLPLKGFIPKWPRLPRVSSVVFGFALTYPGSGTVALSRTGVIARVS